MQNKDEMCLNINNMTRNFSTDPNRYISLKNLTRNDNSTLRII